MGNMTLDCPHCNHNINFGEYENWQDDFMSGDSGIRVECNMCNNSFEVDSNIDITLIIDEEWECEFQETNKGE